MGDGDDAVVGLEFFAIDGGTAGHQFHDFAVAILGPELRADAEERETHADGEIFRGRLAHVVGVGIVDVGQGVHVNLKDLVTVEVAQHPQLAVVPAGDDLDDLGGLFLVQPFLEVFVAEPFQPHFFRLVQVLGAGEFLPVEDVAVIAGELEFCGRDLAGREENVLVISFHEAVEDHFGGRGVAELDGQIAELGAQALEFGDIALQKQQVGRIEGVEVTVKKFRGDGFIERLLRVMRALHDARGQAGDLGVVRTGCELDGVGVARADQRQFGFGLQVRREEASGQMAAENDGRQFHAIKSVIICRRIN